ncbi:MAG: glycosyltransferase family 39 protein [Candidatus Lernaella stagnicola]|nr:glycosyltransferase family 39 protein [Candidatus Lernaella stagnicola]
MSGDLSRPTGALILVAIIAFALSMNLWFIHVDQRPCNINELSHIMGAIDFVNLAPVRPSLYGAYLEAFNGYPPIGLVTSAFYVLFGRTHNVAAASQLPFTMLLLWALYALGARLVDRKTGLIAAALAALSPATVELSRQYLLEMPLTALTTLAVFLMVISEGFTHKRWSVLAGLAVGLAALSKQTFFLFLAGPVVFLLPAWIRAIREDTPPAAPPAPRRRVVLETLGLVAASLLVSWLLYGRHRSTIENWFASYPQYQLPYGWIFFLVTAALLFGIGWLAWHRSTPWRNGLLAALLAVFVASLWYFPKGVLNFVTYLGQMQLNVEKSGMSPGTLLRFYRGHATTYYLGLSTWLAMAGATFMVALFLATKRWLSRWFYLRELVPPRASLLLMALWWGVPFAAFFFISIQNEMNTVPLVPPLVLAAATVVTRVRLPLAAKTRKAIAAGRLQLTPRFLRIATGVVQVLLVTFLIAGGVLMSFPWSGESGQFRTLPGWLNQEKIIADWFPRKIDPTAYLVPRTELWHETEIAEALFDSLPDVPDGQPAPRVLAMDVEFYFSWNTFWYMAKLMNKRVDIRTPWYADADILDENSPDYVQSYDRILYRTSDEPIYQEEKIRNDYRKYRNFLNGYQYLQQRPAEFAARFPVVASFPLPDGTTAVVLRRDWTAPSDNYSPE